MKSCWRSRGVGEYQDQTQRCGGLFLYCGVQKVHTGKLCRYHTVRKRKMRRGGRCTMLRVTLKGQASRPPNTAPSSQESSSSKSAAGAFARLVSRPLCGSESTSISAPPFGPSFLYSTALVLGTCVSHRAARAAMKSASYMFPASERTMRSSVRSQALRPGMMPRFGGRRDAWERASCRIAL